MKLRARATIDVDCGGHLEDQEFEKRIQALVAELGQDSSTCDTTSRFAALLRVDAPRQANVLRRHIKATGKPLVCRSQEIAIARDYGRKATDL